MFLKFYTLVCISENPPRKSAKMNTLTQLFLFSAVVAVALCGAAPREEDVAIMKDTAEAILKLHKLRKHRNSLKFLL